MRELFTSVSLRMCLDRCLGELDAKRRPIKRVNIGLPIERGLVGGIVEYLQKLTPTQMEHELRVNAETFAQLETGGICNDASQ